MPTPLFTLRLSQETQNRLAEMAEIYGADSLRGFVREILETMIAGDPEKVKEFNRRLVNRIAEYTVEDFNRVVDSPDRPASRKAKKKTARKAKKKGKVR